jgi:hypothetical protein
MARQAALDAPIIAKSSRSCLVWSIDSALARCAEASALLNAFVDGQRRPSRRSLLLIAGDISRLIADLMPVLRQRRGSPPREELDRIQRLFGIALRSHEQTSRPDEIHLAFQKIRAVATWLS